MLIVSLLELQSHTVYAMTVVDTECPNDSNPNLIAPCNTISYSCERIDSGIFTVNPGMFDIVEGTAHNCENCDLHCPETMPDPLLCTTSLSVSFQETVTVSLALGISVSTVLVEQAMEASIGHSGARSITRSATCGTASLSGCKMQSFATTLTITKNIQTKMDHMYKWRISIGHNPALCELPNDHPGPYPQIFYEAAGTRTSTATGSSYGSAATCTTINTADCPSED
jgi:hypothetical protein